jgi:hypothetical protein
VLLADISLKCYRLRRVLNENGINYLLGPDKNASDIWFGKWKEKQKLTNYDIYFTGLQVIYL